MADFDSVRVALRVRPLVDSEKNRGCQQAVECINGVPQVLVNGTESFTFNFVFGINDTQDKVYEKCVCAMLDKLFGGFNATILAYGQTGSGKTHTMGTSFDGQPNENVGVIPRAMKDIFERIDKLKDKFEFDVSCSFIELYQEQLYDLLSERSREQSTLEIREDRNGIVISDLTKVPVRTAIETTNCLVRGSTGRAVASTAMNQHSSRSHAIFTVMIEATKLDETRAVTTSKFHFVDLAGSERLEKTQATGDRFKEGVKINHGLLALGNVISELGSGKGSGFVRYRDSKLTRLLQDSLGGNSITLMIACISPADYNVPETLSTLRYADRARKIKNKPIVNQDPHAAEVNRLKTIIQKLRLELLATGGTMSNSLNSDLKTLPPVSVAGSTNIGSENSTNDKKAYESLKEKYRNLQQQFQKTLYDVADSEMRAHIAEAAHEKLKIKTDEIKIAVSSITLDINLTDNNVADNLKVHLSQLEQIKQLVAGLDEELNRTQFEMDDHKRACSLNVSMENEQDNLGEEGGAEIQAQTDAFTSKQMNIKDELRRINRELELKEELQQRIVGNFTKLYTLEEHNEEKLKEFEEKIKELEAAKEDLLEQLRNVKEQTTSAKLAEERRKRLQILEQEIVAMKSKMKQQANMLKIREKETEKIKNLTTDIRQMKESKVKLIRAMRQESDNFRQWKLTREKELIQLKNKDRKMQNEMARKEALHTKQRNVLKRKCEEAMAINKRLKDAMDRQRAAQAQRHKMQLATKNSTMSTTVANSSTMKAEQLVALVDRELELIISIVDAEQSIDHLVEDRSMISGRIAELKKPNFPLPNTPEAQELAQLEEELEMRNAQITDLQQKVCATDLEAHMRLMVEGLQSLVEAKTVYKHLLSFILNMRRESTARYMEQKTILEEQRSSREAAEQRYEATSKRIRILEIEHEEAIAERENTYEEKIALLLRELHNTAPQLAIANGVEGLGGDITNLTPEQMERLKIQTEWLDKMDSLREELELCKKKLAKFEKKQGSKKVEPNPNVVYETEIEEEEEEYSADEDSIMDNDDPDWHETPRIRRKRRLQKSVMNETYKTANSNFDNSETTATSMNGSDGVKRKKMCSCRSGCSNKRCGCYSVSEKCSSNCRCTNCANRKKDDSTDDDNEESSTSNNVVTMTNIKEEPENDLKEESSSDIENKFSRPNDLSSKSLISENTNALVLPKKPRISTMTFNTPTSKKKFFQ